MNANWKTLGIVALVAVGVFMVLSYVQKETVEATTIKDKEGNDVPVNVIKKHWFKIAA